MAKILWDDSYSVGVEQLDKQHKNIIRAINALTDYIEAGNSTKKFLFKLFRALKAYADIHFECEEKIMEEHEFPHLGEHLQEHQNFIRELETLQKSFDSKDEEVNIEMDMMTFLTSWLTSHILTMDKSYTEHLNERGVK